MSYRAVIFDLDGTLLDSLEDLADSMNAVLARQQFPVHAVERYRYFVGDGISELVKRVLPEQLRTDALVAENIRWMSTEYEARWNKKTQPYPGIVELLAALVNGTAAGDYVALLAYMPMTEAHQAALEGVRRRIRHVSRRAVTLGALLARALLVGAALIGRRPLGRQRRLVGLLRRGFGRLPALAAASRAAPTRP